MIAVLRPLAVTALCLLAFVGHAAPVVPKLTGRVVDNAAILSNGVRDRISDLSKAHEQRTTNQIAVVTVASLDGTTIEEFANRVFSTWGLGNRDTDNGILLVVAPNERRVRIEVGYGLEGTLSDAVASRIIRYTITPAFKAGNYDQGIDAGVREIVRVLEGGTVDALPTTGSHVTTSSDLASQPLTTRLSIFLLLLVAMGFFVKLALYAPGPIGWFIGAFLGLFMLTIPVALFGRLLGGIVFFHYLVGFSFIKLRAGPLSQPSKRSSRGPLLDWWTDSSSSGWSSSDASSSSSSDFSGGGGDSGGGGASGSW